MFHDISLSRSEKILSEIDRSGAGLEIGPSYNPALPKKDGWNVEVVDHTDAETLRKKYADHDVDITKIEQVDYVWRGEPLSELIGNAGAYDFIIASHVIEHTTDLVTFLQECSKLLKAGGVLSLAIPDMRYCFDYFRPLSSTGDVLQAYLDKRTRHTAATAFDQAAYGTRKGENIIWHQLSRGDMKAFSSVEAAWDMAQKEHESVEYFDHHNWCFTPSSMRLILDDLNQIGLLDIRECAFFDTLTHEFFISLKKGGVRHRIQREELAAETLNELAESAPARDKLFGLPKLFTMKPWLLVLRGIGRLLFRWQR